MVVSDDPDSISVGSFFTNPIVSDELSRRLPADAPRFPLEGDRAPVVVPLGADHEFTGFNGAAPDVKLSAAWLIERAGVPRGFSLPGNNAGVSSKHTLALVNRGGATAREVIELARYISIRVHDTFGIMLSPEPTMIARGFGTAAVLMIIVVSLFLIARAIGGQTVAKKVKARERRAQWKRDVSEIFRWVRQEVGRIDGQVRFRLSSASRRKAMMQVRKKVQSAVRSASSKKRNR